MNKLIWAMLLGIILVGCQGRSQVSQPYDGNDIYNLVSGGYVVEDTDASLYYTKYENEKVFLYHVTESLDLISKQEIKIREESVGLRQLNIVGNVLYGYDAIKTNGFEFDEKEFVSLELDPNIDILDAKKLYQVEDSRLMVVFILVSNDRIYHCYTSSEGYSYGINSYNLKGRDEESLEGSFMIGSYVSEGNTYQVGPRDMKVNDQVRFSLEGTGYDPQDIVVTDDYVYFYGVSSDQENMLRFELNEEMGKQVLAEDLEIIVNGKAVPINVGEDILLYWQDGKTYQSKLNGSHQIEIFDSLEQIMMTKNYLAIGNRNGVSFYDFNGVEVTVNQ